MEDFSFPFFTTVAQVYFRATVDGPADGVAAISGRRGSGVGLGGAVDTVSVLNR